MVATLSFYATKDGRITVTYQGWDQSKVVLESSAGKDGSLHCHWVGSLVCAFAIAVRVCDENSALAPDTALEAMEADCPKRAARCHVRG